LHAAIAPAAKSAISERRTDAERAFVIDRTLLVLTIEALAAREPEHHNSNVECGAPLFGLGTTARCSLSR
jgi:hypothetical protein